ncbi:ATPase [Corchorus capsularis]|uniref:ATPase n=1 Tax=Corchorus capsularis TaxID=210143 RepID=A0A1R3FX00_COCAP|nr:ATPase [Corchorus capsularis]
MPLIHEVLNENKPDMEGLWSLALVVPFLRSVDLLIAPQRDLPFTPVFLHYLGQFVLIMAGTRHCLPMSFYCSVPYASLNDVKVYGWIEKKVETEDEDDQNEEENVNGRDAETARGEGEGEGAARG